MRSGGWSRRTSRRRPTSRASSRLAIARDCLPPAVAIGGVDMMSPLGDLQGIMDQTLMFLSMKQHPDALHRACDVVTATQEAVQEATLEAVGGQSRLAGLSNWPIWRPEGAKVLVTDDVAGLLSPAVYEAFDKPYGDRLLRRYGGGLRHVCGPHPALSLYMTADPPVHGLNCAYRFSRDTLAALKQAMGPGAREACGRRGHLEIMFERDMSLSSIVAAFRDLAGVLAPDVVAIPYCQVASDGSVSDDESSRSVRRCGVWLRSTPRGSAGTVRRGERTVHVVIIGNSAAGLSALESLRRRDRAATVTVVSREGARPYSRVLLPYYLRGRIPHAGVFVRPEDYYERLDARTAFGEVVEGVDPKEHEVLLRGGRTIVYDRLLVATGSRAAAPPIEGLAGPGVQGFWTLDDAERLDRGLRPGARLMVLGAGFVALQAAWAAHRRGAAVTVVELEGRILPRVLDEEAAHLLRAHIERAGVRIATDVCIAGVERACGELCCTATSADTYQADTVIVATGVLPNDGLLPEAVSARGRGLEVAPTMETAVAGVYAAGDVARAPLSDGAVGVLALWPVAVARAGWPAPTWPAPDSSTRVA